MNPYPWKSRTFNRRWARLRKLSESPNYWLSVVDEDSRLTFTTELTPEDVKGLRDWVMQEKLR